MTPFAVSDIKYKILGTPFFGKSIQKKHQDFTMNFNHSFNDQRAFDSCSKLIEKIFLFFSFFLRNRFKKVNLIKTNTVQPLHFPLKITKILLPKIEDHEPQFDKMLQTQFVSKFKRYFLYGKIIEELWRLVDSFPWKNTMHIATLATGIMGYIKIHITTVKPSGYSFLMN